MAAHRNRFGVERLPSRMPFEERVDYVQRPLVHKDGEWTDNFSGEESMKRHGEVVCSIQHGSIATSLLEPVKFLPNHRRPVTLFLEQV
jgi:hypothetical protein